MRKSARCFLFALALCFMCIALPRMDVSAATYGGSLTSNLKWEIKDDTLRIYGTGYMPSYYYNKVESAGKTWYESTAPWGDYYDHFSKIVIEEGVTNIGSYAFYWHKSLDCEIKLPSTLKSIDVFAFAYCNGLKGDLIIPEGVTEVSSGAFASCTGLNGKLSLPSTIKVIGTPYTTGAFTGCSGLTGDLNLPEGLEQITGLAFAGCSGLTGDLDLPSTLTRLGEQAFSGCSGLTGDVVIPQGITYINPSVFSDCSGLDGVLKLHDGITGIGGNAFSGCTGLTGDLVIPNSVSSIGASAFRGCTGFESLKLTENESYTAIDNYTFSGCTGFTEIEIPDQITNIKCGAFKGCTGITGILELPDSIVTLSPTSPTGYSYQGAFMDCTGITGVKFGSGIEKIGYHTFWGCTGLEGTMTIPDTVDFIGDYAFRDCTGLEKLILPKYLNETGSCIIWGSGITDIFFLGDVPAEIDEYTFSNTVVNAWYPPKNDTWNEETKLQYGYNTCKVTWYEWTCPDMDRPHTAGEISYENVVEATCKNGGSYTEKYTCTCCFVTVSTNKTTGILPHNEEMIPMVLPTVGSDGHTAGSVCTSCGETIVAPETIPSLLGDYQVENGVLVIEVNEKPSVLFFTAYDENGSMKYIGTGIWNGNTCRLMLPANAEDLVLKIYFIDAYSSPMSCSYNIEI